MSKTRDYIPQKDAEFDGWLNNLNNYVQDMASGPVPAWTFIPLPRLEELRVCYLNWRGKYLKTQGEHSNVDTEAKNDAKKAAIAVVRPFVAQYLKFPPVTDEDRTTMRLHNRDTTPTPIPPPATRVVMTDIRALGGFQIRIWFRDEMTPNSHAIPYGNNGCLLFYTWGRERVTDVSVLKETQLLTRSPETVTLPPESQGSFFSCAARWQNEKGELGPWSDVEHVVIG